MKILNLLRSLTLVVLALAAANMTAANVDAVAAQARAVQFMNSLAGTRFMASPTSMKLTHAEMSSVDKTAADFYVFNYDGGGFVIVSGDDRAEEILGYGEGTLDVNNIPDNLRWWLGQYKEQMEFLIKNPKLRVEKSSEASTVLRASTVSPLLTCTWDQNAPFWNQCPSYGGSRCYTGCVATAMAQVMYYWKYPAQLPAIASYRTSSYNISVSALPGTTVDWDNMIDDYTGNYTSAQGTAVATLMRYCGQSCSMDYTPDGSGAYTPDQLAGMKLFGYNSGATYVQRANYSDSQWTAMILEDLRAGRPVLYGGDDGYYGHAFVVDGYDGSKYHVNWGWSGEDDGYFAISSFYIDSDYDFRQNQDMLYQIYPENMEVLETYEPVMADAGNVGNTSFKASWTDATPSENVQDYTLYVQAYDPNSESLLTETFAGVTVSNDGTANISNSLDNYCDNAGWTGAYVYQGAGGTMKVGSGSYAGSLTTPALDMSTCGGTITVKFNAKYYGSDASSVVITCGNVTETVELTSTAADYAVVLTGVNAAAGQKVTFAGTAKKKRFYIDNIEIVTGNAANMFRATETGDANSRVITGITAKNYTVTGLTEGGSYRFYVEANYIDGTKKQSNVKTVTLEGTAEPIPEIIVDPETLTMTANVGETATATIDVLASDLKGNVTVTLSDANGVYTVNPATISKADAQEGTAVTVTYAPTTAGTHAATITLSSEGAENVTVTINGTAAMQTTAPVLAAATNVGTTSFTAVWTDETPAQNVTDYTLHVNKVGGAGEELLAEAFGGVTANNDGTTRIDSDLDTYCDNAGWTGTYVYQAGGGGLKFGNSSNGGGLTTPALDLTNCGGTITVKFNARNYGSDETSLTVSCGEVSETVSLTETAADYSVTLNGVTAAANQQVTIASSGSKQRWYLYNVTITSGVGGGEGLVFTGITAKTYTVNGLTPGETYNFYVVANYADGTSATSNTEQVTLENALVPEIIVDPETLTMAANVGETATATLDVLAANLTGNVTVTLTDENGVYTVTPASISIAEAEEGATVTVTYAPAAAGTHTATITLSSEGAEDVTVTVTGTASMPTGALVMLPADEEFVTSSSFRADWTDETAAQYVTDYTLYVNIKQEIPVGATLLAETFYSEDVPSEDNSRDIGENNELDEYCDNAGWTGYGVYLAGGGGLKLGAGSKVGTLTTPALDLTNCGGTITVKFNARSYGSDASSVIVSCGEVADTLELTAENADYTVVLTGVNAAEAQNVTFSCTTTRKRIYLNSVTIISGDATVARTVTEAGDENSRVITGITDKYYVVEGLTAGATYTYYVEANYIDGSKVASNVETVTLLENASHDYEVGDVNHDGIVNITDVTMLIGYVLNSGGSACQICGDMNGDGNINVTDVTMIIAKVLN